MNACKQGLFRFLPCVLIAAGALALDAQPPGPPPPHHPSRPGAQVHHVPPSRPGMPRGYREVRMGNAVYYTHRGVFYRSGPRGYVVVLPPVGIRVPVLPPNYARVYAGGVVYYRYNNIYYQPVAGGYIVVSTPVGTVVASTAAPAPESSASVAAAPAAGAVPDASTLGDYQSLRVGGAEYYFKDGQFFQKTGDSSLVWVAAPVGAVAGGLPPDAVSVWYQDVEYFDCDGVYFRKTPEGYRVVEAPWAAVKE